MNLETLLRRILLVISVLTVVSGATQLIYPGFVLKLLSAEVTPTSSHFFATIGMFMIGFGGVFAHSLLSRPEPVVALWASLQKFGAAAMVALGVSHSLFSALALGVAGFDLLSGLLGILYWRKISAAAPY